MSMGMLFSDRDVYLVRNMGRWERDVLPRILRSIDTLQNRVSADDRSRGFAILRFHYHRRFGLSS